MRQLGNEAGDQGNIGQLHHDSLDINVSKVEVYAKWADTYDAGVAGEDYRGPMTVSKAVVNHLKPGATEQPYMVLDAGCGTGLVGAQLLKIAPQDMPMQVVGCDISVPMVVKAREKGYSSCFTMDLNCPMTLADDAFDAATCAGTFVHAHVVPDPLLPELVRVVKPGGLVVATVRRSLYDSDPSYSKVIEQLKNAGHEITLTEFQYLKGVTAFLVSVKVGGSPTPSVVTAPNLPSATGIELPRQMGVQELVKCMRSQSSEALNVLDACCGMGETGTAIAAALPKGLKLHGCDLSSMSVSDAPGCYQDVQQADTREPLKMYPDSEFDGVVCIGALAPGSGVQPTPLVEELVRVTQPGGAVILTADRAPLGGKDSWLQDYAALQDALGRVRDAGHSVTQVAVQVSPSGLVTDMVTISKNP